MNKTLDGALQARKMQVAVERMRERLAQLKLFSAMKSNADTEHKDFAAEILVELTEVDGENGPGVRFEYGGKEWAAFVCRPQDQQTWDAAPLVEWLKTNGHWDKVSVTVLDPQKLEVEMAAGNIPRKALAKFIQRKPSTPYVKFGNPKPDSK